MEGADVARKRRAATRGYVCQHGTHRYSQLSSQCVLAPKAIIKSEGGLRVLFSACLRARKCFGAFVGGRW